YHCPVHQPSLPTRRSSDLHPTLTMRRWTDDDLDGTATGRICRRHPGLAPVVIADLLRVEAVSLYGGLYMDSDTIPLRSLDEWTRSEEHTSELQSRFDLVCR